MRPVCSAILNVKRKSNKTILETCKLSFPSIVKGKQILKENGFTPASYAVASLTQVFRDIFFLVVVN